MTVQTAGLDALVLRADVWGENDLLLTLLSAEEGRFCAILKGAHALNRFERAPTEPFTWTSFDFYQKKDMRWVRNATMKEAFPGIRLDMEKLFLAAYLADVAYELSGEHEPAGEILPLTLNALHLLSEGKTESRLVKAVFEMRAAAVSGYLPDLSACLRCGKPVGTEDTCLDVMNGGLVCSACLHKNAHKAPLPEVSELGERHVLCPLTAGAAAALSYVVNAEPKRVFAFQLTDEASRDTFCRAAEVYLLHHLERGFLTLENYKRILSAPQKYTL